MNRASLLLIAALVGLSATQAEAAKPKARAKAPAAAKPAAPSEAPAHTPLAIEDVEIHGERLVPQAIYIVGGSEADAEAAASVSDYLSQLGPATDRMPAALFLTSERR